MSIPLRFRCRKASPRTWPDSLCRGHDIREVSGSERLTLHRAGGIEAIGLSINGLRNRD